jgi:phosphatidylinositol alpha-1,6-mannosyltransferase
MLAAAASQPVYVLKAVAAVIRLRPSFIFCGHLYLDPLALILSFLFRIPWWLHLHGVETWLDTRRRALKAAKYAHMITTVSRFTRLQFLKRVPAAPAKVLVFPNTAWPIGKRPDIGRIASRILTVSRLSYADREKGIDRVVSAIPSLLREFPELSYHVIGDGDDQDRLKSLARKLQIEGHVRFLGRIDDSARTRELAEAQVLILPSSIEGFGLVFVEAAMAGCHIIGGNVDGSLDALGDGTIGMAVNPNDQEAIICALKGCLMSPPPFDNPDRAFSLFGPEKIRIVLSGLIRNFKRSNADANTNSKAGW